MSIVKDVFKSPELNSYNEEPVVYCRSCLSLAIRTCNEVEYCDKCGHTEVEETDIVSWEKLYEDKYGEKLIKN